MSVKHGNITQVKNVSLGNDSNRNRSFRKKQRSSNWDIEIQLETNDKNRLKKFMTHELKAYNKINEVFYTRYRSNPEMLTNLDRWEKVFGQLAYDGYNVYEILYPTKTTPALPESLQPYEDLLLGNDPGGGRKLTESIAILLEGAAYPTNIHPEVRKNMALEIFRFYREQAKLAVQPINKKVSEEQAYRIAPSFLEPMDIIRKRHVQIPRKILKIQWNEELNKCRIFTPYTTTPIVIPGFNLINEHWNLLILHQIPGRIPKSDDAWVASIKDEQHGYMLKYLDQNSPYSGNAFFQAKAK